MAAHLSALSKSDRAEPLPGSQHRAAGIDGVSEAGALLCERIVAEHLTKGRLYVAAALRCPALPASPCPGHLKALRLMYACIPFSDRSGTSKHWAINLLVRAVDAKGPVHDMAPPSEG